LWGKKINKMENSTTTTERLIKLIKWEQMYGFVKDNYKHNPKFLEYDEILNDENEMFEWFKQWCRDGECFKFNGVYLNQLTK
jgi:hypothetical protein